MKWSIGSFVVICVFAASNSLAQAPGGVELQALASESEPAARAALGTLRKLITADNARAMGFDEVGDVAQAELGRPLADFMIGLDAIRNYQQGQDAVSLVMPTNEIVYSVGTEAGVNASITLKKENDHWTAVSFGSPVVSQATAGTIESTLRNSNAAGENVFRLRIPAYNLVFVAYVEDGALMLSPVNDFAEFGLSAGETVTGEEVLLTLRPFALRDDEGLLR